MASSRLIPVLACAQANLRDLYDIKVNTAAGRDQLTKLHIKSKSKQDKEGDKQQWRQKCQVSFKKNYSRQTAEILMVAVANMFLRLNVRSDESQFIWYGRKGEL